MDAAIIPFIRQFAAVDSAWFLRTPLILELNSGLMIFLTQIYLKGL